MLHSGHVAFFKEASAYGDLYVGIGSDATIEGLKGRKPVYSENERLYMVRAIRHVKEAYINSGSGMMDFVETVERVRPEEGLEARSTTSIRSTVKSQLPFRLDLAGTWIDQPYVSKFCPGWAITISLEPTMEFEERCGMSTSTRNAAKKIWPYHLPDYNSEMLAKLLFCFENEPNKKDHVSGAQDAIGICVPGLCRHFYDNNYWPEKIETCHDESVLSWLEEHICMEPMFPRRPGTSVVDGCDLSVDNVHALTAAAERCWDAIMRKDLRDFAAAYQASFEAQIRLFPGMMAEGVAENIEKYKNRALAWKMPGAGGGGYLAMVCERPWEGSIRIKIRRGTE